MKLPLTVLISLVVVVTFCEAKLNKIAGKDEYCVQGKNWQTVLKKCAEKEKASESDIREFIALEDSKTDNGKCLRLCLAKECNALDEDGKVLPTVPKRAAKLFGDGDSIKEKHIIEVFSKCADNVIYGDNVCQNYEDYFKCVTSTCQDCGIDLSEL